MTHDTPLALTPEQVAAVAAGGGIAHAEDPTTHARYTLVDCRCETTHSDEFLRDKLAEGTAQLERGEGIDWDLDAFKQRLAERLEKDGQAP